ncbi:MAG: ankyrin repeat domain-containing protein [Proteobacteria bacterium]|nr:ankyrin repeat domain-containing protein [Pseudomonadota bacterium]
MRYLLIFVLLFGNCVVFSEQSYAGYYKNNTERVARSFIFKKDSPYKSIYKLSINKDPEICGEFIKFKEKTRHLVPDGYFDSQFKIGEQVKPDKRFKGCHFGSITPLKKGNITHYYYIYGFDCGGPLVYTNTGVLDHYPTKKELKQEVRGVSFNRILNVKEKDLILGYTKRPSEGVKKWFKEGSLYSYDFETKQFDPFCSTYIDEEKLNPSVEEKFKDFTFYYKKIAGHGSGCMSRGRQFYVKDGFVNQFYDYLMNPGLVVDRKTKRNFNIYEFLNNWAKYSPENKRDYVKMMKAFMRLKEHISNYYDQHIEFKDEKHRKRIIAYVVRDILNQIHVGPYDISRVDQFISKIQHGTVTEEELKSRLNKDVKPSIGYYVTAAPPIFHALGNHGLLKKMIKIGYDVNEKNWFSKTPLMTAAHLNNFETVKILVNAGANLEDEMGELNKIISNKMEDFNSYGSRCYYNVQRQNRTALMYATENASYELIKYLIDQGASTKAFDSQNNGIEFYLNKNEILTDKEKAKILKMMH